MIATPDETPSAWIELRQQAHYWRALHARAAARATFYEGETRRLQEEVRQKDARIAELTSRLEALQVKNLWLRQQLFGRKSEQRPASAPEAPEEGPSPEGEGGEERRPRGQQPGAAGHGRKRREGLPTEEVFHDLPEGERRCPRCAEPFEPFPGTEDCEEIGWEVRLVRRLHRRLRYRPTCSCGVVAGVVAAPAPAKVIPKGLFSTEFWARVLVEKFLFQRPLFRLRQVLAMEGLSVSQGTLTGGLERMRTLLEPLYRRILERSRGASHWHLDETWWMVFVEIEGKEGYRWWLWVVVTKDAVVYLLEPTRSGSVPRDYLGEGVEGIASVDRYAGYKRLPGTVRLSYCWVHARRDFLGIERGHRRLAGWAREWVEAIADLYRRNEARLSVRGDAVAFAEKDRALREAVADLEGRRERELAEATLHPAQQKVLTSLRNHWQGLTIFVEHPEIPMDNNEAERRLRNPVVGRKNYYGSGSLWSGRLAAILFTVFQTYLLHGLDPQRLLQAYLEACARNGGRPPRSLRGFLPWRMSAKEKAAWALGNRSP